MLKAHYLLDKGILLFWFDTFLNYDSENLLIFKEFSSDAKANFFISSSRGVGIMPCKYGLVDFMFCKKRILFLKFVFVRIFFG